MIQLEISPKLSAHLDAIGLDPALFARVRTLYDGRVALGLDGESAELLKRTYTRFVRAGASLSDADKATLRTMNATLASTFEHPPPEPLPLARPPIDRKFGVSGRHSCLQAPPDGIR